MLDDRELTLRCAIRVAETLRSQVTFSARRFRGFETGNTITIEEHVLAGTVELVPCGAGAARVCLVVEEVLLSE